MLPLYVKVTIQIPEDAVEEVQDMALESPLARKLTRSELKDFFSGDIALVVQETDSFFDNIADSAAEFIYELQDES